jgi:hypothetical protein
VLTIQDFEHVEGSGGTTRFAIQVTLTAAAPEAIVVDYATAAGTAEAGSDFIAQRGAISFAPGEISKTIEIQVVGDSVKEDDEQFTILIVAPWPVSRPVATITIRDDDSGTSRRRSARH